jgi:hypothetical protein
LCHFCRFRTFPVDAAPLRDVRTQPIVELDDCSPIDRASERGYAFAAFLSSHATPLFRHRDDFPCRRRRRRARLASLLAERSSLLANL